LHATRLIVRALSVFLSFSFQGSSTCNRSLLFLADHTILEHFPTNVFCVALPLVKARILTDVREGDV